MPEQPNNPTTREASSAWKTIRGTGIRAPWTELLGWLMVVTVGSALALEGLTVLLGRIWRA